MSSLFSCFYQHDQEQSFMKGGDGDNILLVFIRSC